MRAENAQPAIHFGSGDKNSDPTFASQQQFDPEGGPISQLVSRSLSVRRRGAVGNDGLVVRSLSARLRVQLLARPMVRRARVAKP